MFCGVILIIFENVFLCIAMFTENSKLYLYDITNIFVTSRTHKHIYTNRKTCIIIHIYKQIHSNLRTCTNMHSQTHKHIRAHTLTYTYHTHTHTYTCKRTKKTTFMFLQYSLRFDYVKISPLNCLTVENSYFPKCSCPKFPQFT